MGSGTIPGPGTQRHVRYFQRAHSAVGEKSCPQMLKVLCDKCFDMDIFMAVWAKDRPKWNSFWQKWDIIGSNNWGSAREPGSRHSRIQVQMTSSGYSPSPGFIAPAWLSVAGDSCMEWNEKRPRSVISHPPPSKICICASSCSKISYTHTHTHTHTHTPSPQHILPNKTVLYRDFLNDTALHSQF